MNIIFVLSANGATTLSHIALSCSLQSVFAILLGVVLLNVNLLCAIFLNVMLIIMILFGEIKLSGIVWSIFLMNVVLPSVT